MRFNPTWMQYPIGYTNTCWLLRENLKDTAALGYSNFYNISSSDLRTSSIEASIQADIAIEGTNKTYRQIIEDFVSKYTTEEQLDLNKSQKQELVEYLLINR